ncbi:MAG: hypothetical protein GY861_09780 [bacterium]|nr:hypothetical protein [bacterium]
MIHLSTLLKHYKRADIQEEIVLNAQDREVAARFNDKFGARPDTIKYPKDVLEFAKQGVTSFHASEERWRNSAMLVPSMKPSELDELRTGWDLVLDIDCKFLDYSKIASDLVVQALQHHGITSISAKFSGNKGFHIGVPFEAFPEEVHGKEARLLFPEGVRRVALYIKEMIKKPLGKEIMRYEGDDFKKVIEKTGLKEKEIVYYERNELGLKIPYLNVEPFLGIDTVLISSRHLYRMPYTFNEKSSLVSVPVDPYKIREFDIETANPDNVKVSKFRFLDKETAKKDDARQLLMQAFDFSIKKEEKVKRTYEVPADAINEDYFPPCIKKILCGLEDGKKRSLFILANFLSSCGWGYEEMKQRIEEWNKKNPEPLREVYLKGHMRYLKNKKPLLPPNCENKGYYPDLRVCEPDNLCGKIKNPVNYARRKAGAGKQ